MQERIKQIRKTLKMNQKEFSNLLGVGQSTLAMMEVSKRDVSDRHIKTICAICNVNEEWLRTGNGEMCKSDENSVVSQLVDEFNLDDLDRAIIESYLQLGELQRKVIKDYIKTLSSAIALPVQTYKIPALSGTKDEPITDSDRKGLCAKQHPLQL